MKARIALLHSRLNLFLAQLVVRISASVIRPRGITAKASTSTRFQSRKRPNTSRLSALRSPAASTSLHSNGSKRRCWDCQRASGSMGRRVIAAKRTRDACGILASICCNLMRPISECTVSQRVAECKVGFKFSSSVSSGAMAWFPSPHWGSVLWLQRGVNLAALRLDSQADSSSTGAGLWQCLWKR